MKSIIKKYYEGELGMLKPDYVLFIGNVTMKLEEHTTKWEGENKGNLKYYSNFEMYSVWTELEINHFVDGNKDNISFSHYIKCRPEYYNPTNIVDEMVNELVEKFIGLDEDVKFNELSIKSIKTNICFEYYANDF